jgi:hypothetical protein
VIVAIVVSLPLGYLATGEALYYWKEHAHHYEAGAISALMALHTIQENYRTDHGSYAGDFAQLGMPLGAGLERDLLTWGGPYRYRMDVVERNKTGAVVAYCVQARPVRYSRGNRTSYFMDRTGRIHLTSADRAAVINDPAVSTEH